MVTNDFQGLDQGGGASVGPGPFFQRDFQTKYKTPPSSRPRFLCTDLKLYIWKFSYYLSKKVM